MAIFIAFFFSFLFRLSTTSSSFVGERQDIWHNFGTSSDQLFCSLWYNLLLPKPPHMNHYIINYMRWSTFSSDIWYSYPSVCLFYQVILLLNSWSFSRKSKHWISIKLPFRHLLLIRISWVLLLNGKNPIYVLLLDEYNAIQEMPWILGVLFIPLYT